MSPNTYLELAIMAAFAALSGGLWSTINVITSPSSLQRSAFIDGMTGVPVTLMDIIFTSC